MPEKTDLLLRLGHSPDPDDAFMFYGLAKNKLPTGRYRFEHILQDIQTLNHRAMHGELEITAISIHAYPYVSDKYALTSCGSSMGDNYGPMVIARNPVPLQSLKGKTIAIPGELTTAFLALQLCLGKGAKKGTPVTSSPAFFYEIVHFDQIPAYVRDGKADAGLIIHEGQLTYSDNGLVKALDLGQWWREQTGLPLPLGGNAIRRALGEDTMRIATNALRDSIQHALDHREQALEYAMQFARDLDPTMANRFVGMYVNDRTLNYGPDGREAIQKLLEMGYDRGIIPIRAKVDFVG
jgi:1,4-dihydroxy-6-naphthoate synthase